MVSRAYEYGPASAGAAPSEGGPPDEVPGSTSVPASSGEGGESSLAPKTEHAAAARSPATAYGKTERTTDPKRSTSSGDLERLRVGVLGVDAKRLVAMLHGVRRALEREE